MTDTANKCWLIEVTEPDGKTVHTVKVDTDAPTVSGNHLNVADAVGRLLIELFEAHDRTTVEAQPGTPAATQPVQEPARG